MNKRTATTFGTLAAVIVLALLSWLFGGGDDSGSPEPSSSSSASTSSNTARAPSSTSASSSAASDGLATISESDLPVQARQLLTLIDDGGPFPSGDRDGVVFRNDEGLLPDHQSGYYHEYTARTPGESDRGARRIIAGAGGELYWTADHYQSFSRIVRS